jgi:hypothetical protein
MLLSSVGVNVARTIIFVVFVVSAFPFRSCHQPAPLQRQRELLGGPA